MLINRRSKKLTKHFADQLHQQSGQLNNSLHNQIEITSYPSCEYLFGTFLIAFSAYLFYSAGGGENGIKGLMERKWWQFIVALVPMILGLCFIIACQVERIIISRKENSVISTKTRCFCFLTSIVKKQLSDLVGISVVKSGNEQLNVTMVDYQIILSFKTCEQLNVLRCRSSERALSYFEEIRRMFDQNQISRKRVVIKNLID